MRGDEKSPTSLRVQEAKKCASLSNLRLVQGEQPERHLFLRLRDEFFRLGLGRYCAPFTVTGMLGGGTEGTARQSFLQSDT